MHRKTFAACLVLMLATLANGFAPKADWVRYTSVDGRYTALVPQLPTLKTQEATAATGQKFTQYLAQTADTDSVYMVSYFDYTADMAFSLDKGRDGMISAVNGTLLSEEVISLEGNPGRALKVETTNQGVDLLIRARFYNVGTRVYVLQHMTVKATDSLAIAQKATRFFDSFKVTTTAK